MLSSFCQVFLQRLVYYTGMQSILIVGADAEKRTEKVVSLCGSLMIDPLDISEFGRQDDAIAGESSIGIALVKQMQQKLFLKPLRSKNKAVVIHNAHLLTPEAQNALLKVLEEPPLNTYLILSAEREDALLPTILSRCAIRRIEEEGRTLTQDEMQEFTETIEELQTFSIGEGMKLAETLAKNKQQALTWLEKSMLAARNTLLSDSTHDTRTLRLLQESYTQLKTTNVNPRLTLENLFLELSDGSTQT